MQLRRVISTLVAVCQLGMGVLIPAADAAAKTGELAWAAPTNYVWRNTKTGNAVQMWDPQWNLIAQVKVNDSNGKQDIRMINGPGWITSNLYVDTGGNSVASQVLGGLRNFANKTGSMVYGRYSPTKKELRVNIVRAFKNEMTGVLDIQERAYAPVDGRWFVQNKDYLTPEEKRGATIGNDPFLGMSATTASGYPDYTDPVFYNVNSVSDAEVIMGRAGWARENILNATIALLAVEETRIDQKQSQSGNFFKRTIKQEVDGFTNFRWFVGLPVGQAGGVNPAFCAKQMNPCPTDYTVRSGYSWAQWHGGNMPEQFDHIFHWETSSSSWTLASFTIIVMLAATVVTAGASAALALANLAAFSTAGVVGGGVLAGAAYAGAGLSQGGGGLDMTQSNVAYGNIGRNLTPAQAPTNEVQAGLNAALDSQVMTPNPQNSISGMRSAYAGNCPTQYSVRQCWAEGLDPGHILRSDVYKEWNGVLQLRDRYDWCQNRGWTGRDLNLCAIGALDQQGRDIYGSYMAPRLSPQDNYIVNSLYKQYPD